MRRTLLVPLLSTRSVVLLGAMLIALGLLVVGMVGTSAKPADAATNIVTKAFHNTNQITIPASTTSPASLPYPSLISPTFPKGTKVRDVNVTLRNYTHTFPDDVDVLLVHAGTNRTIMSDVGLDIDVNNITIRLDDEASSLLPGSGQLTAGAFKPTNEAPADTFPFPAPNPASANTSLAGFDTLNARGAWKLFVVDDVPAFDSGTFAGGWTVTIRAAVPA